MNVKKAGDGGYYVETIRRKHVFRTRPSTRLNPVAEIGTLKFPQEDWKLGDRFRIRIEKVEE